VVTDVVEPVAAEDEIIVNVTAAPVAQVDRHIASATSYLGVPPFPYTPGMHGTGITEDGHHVWFLTGAGVGGRRSGSAAERVAVARAQTLELPAGDELTAAALGGSAIAAVGALRRGGLAPGTTCVVLGANGVVGRIGLQYARETGARVVAVARGAAAGARARELGAVEYVDAASGDLDEITQALHEACPDGADVVLDPVWGVPATAALRVLAPNGRLVNVGDAAGPVLSLPSALLRSRSLQVLGWTNQSLSWAQQGEILGELLAMVKRSRLVADATVVPLQDATAAWDREAPGQLLLIP
jgi:NADPH:quinone reductase-like Zn-dependent oxidoreductase